MDSKPQDRILMQYLIGCTNLHDEIIIRDGTKPSHWMWVDFGCGQYSGEGWAPPGLLALGSPWKKMSAKPTTNHNRSSPGFTRSAPSTIQRCGGVKFPMVLKRRSA
ncbi:hypothetical protein PoB_002832100 [Plakobranchus ocellatus]|uniref:Uncharacterized protein n=1 Tax=Plakobranchus ocellatus TaxID=259542 RepID=A0AAV4A5A6_9GAST|nr:hypothetical protein PoB_002832100 [Plakobranchus ocellatus]